jgi:hypothetical protein
MITLLFVIKFLNLLIAGIFAGALFSASAALRPAFRNLSGKEFTKLHQLTTHTYDPLMPILLVLSMLSAIFVLFLSYNFEMVNTWLLISGLICELIVGLISFAVPVPINKDIDKWSVDSPPANFSEVRARWDFYHNIRTIFGVLAFCFFIVFALFG